VTWRRLLILASRLLFSLFFILTSAYCLLAYIPFTYQQVIAGRLFPWVTAFARLFPFLYWAVLCVVGLSMLDDLRDARARYVPIGFLALLALLGIPLTLWPVLPSLRTDARSLVLSLAALVPIFCLAALDWLSHWKGLEWSDSPRDDTGRVFYAACASALFLALLYAVITFARCALGWATPPQGNVWLLSLQWTLVSHLLVFMSLFLAVDFIAALSRLFARPPKAEFLLLLALVLVVVWADLRFVVFLPFSFSGLRATLVALAMAAGVVATVTSLDLNMHEPGDEPVESGVSLLLAPIRPLRSASRLNSTCFVLLIPGVAYWLAYEAAGMDWGFVAQKSAVILIWALIFACFYTLLPVSGGVRSPLPTYAVAIVVLGGYVALLVGQRAAQATSSAPEEEANQTLVEYSDIDVSFRLAHGLLSGPASGVLPRPGDEGRFYAFLAENTDIPRSTRIKAVPARLVSDLTPYHGPRPNIFIFVIDSLRRDYVSTYNPAASFTPALGSFGKDSVVMENAFTQYGGTALSEPCIWAGAVLLHQEYTNPFYPMNALEDLLTTDGYESYVSVDNILRAIVKPGFPTDHLDQDRGTMDLRLCSTLSELENKLGQLHDRSRPVFAYTQSQDIHIAVLNREGRSVPAGWSFPGFDPAVASRLAPMDKCFGEFIAFLKNNGLYDNSIIIVTSDHGDSLGEGGRMGHAYYIFPEIIRVPLIIHLPRWLKADVWDDPDSLAFLTDITPSLYYLLGHHPILRNGIYGRPLFTKDRAEQAPYLRSSYLIASSYGPVYGILSGGNLLFIADGVNYEDYLFDATAGPAGIPRPLDDTDRTEYRRDIVNDILAIDRYYGFEPPGRPVVFP
jgi:Sulfatase